MSDFVVGLFLGAAICFIAIVATTQGPIGTRDACRAAHPGHDCDIGWVVGEAFK